MKWIYLEHDHRKRISDGIGAVVKRSMKDIVAFNPDVPIYDAQQLLERLPDITLSIAYHLAYQQVRGTKDVHEMS